MFKLQFQLFYFAGYFDRVIFQSQRNKAIALTLVELLLQ